MSNEQNKAHAVPQGEPVAWYEYDETRDCWFLAYTRNPRVITRPLVFGDVLPAPAAPSQPGALTDSTLADIQDRLVSISGYVADQDDRAAQAILKETLKIIAALREKDGK